MGVEETNLGQSIKHPPLLCGSLMNTGSVPVLWSRTVCFMFSTSFGSWMEAAAQAKVLIRILLRRIQQEKDEEATWKLNTHYKIIFTQKYEILNIFQCSIFKIQKSLVLKRDCRASSILNLPKIKSKIFFSITKTRNAVYNIICEKQFSYTTLRDYTSTFLLFFCCVEMAS